MRQKAVPFSIAGQQIQPGERQTVEFGVAKLYNKAELYMNAHVVHGKSAGPVLFVSAAVHGDELNGVEIIRRLLRLKLLQSIRGTLIAVPVVNTFGFVSSSRYLPDRRDLNRFFPGSNKGSLASRLAYTFMEEIVNVSSYGLDFHSASNLRNNLPQIRANMQDGVTHDLAMAFGAPVAIDANLRDGSLRQAATERDVPVLLYEGGQSMRFDEIPIRVGLRGVLSVMRHLRMLPAHKRQRKTSPVFLAKRSTWARADSSGMFVSRVKLGDSVQQGQPIGFVTEPLGEQDSVIVSPASGIVIGRLESPMVHEGDALCHIAVAKDMDVAEAALDSYQKEFEVETDMVRTQTEDDMA